MATNSEARKARERRLRAKYRKKTVTVSIITLIIGLLLGFVLCAVSVSHPGPISRMLGVAPVDAASDLAPAGLTDGEDDEFAPDAEGDLEDGDLDALEDDSEEDALDALEGDLEEGDLDAFEDEPDVVDLEAEPTPEPTPEPTDTPEPTPEPTPAPQIIPFGQSFVVQTEVNADGTPRKEASGAPYETLNFSLKVDAHRGPDYFQSQYGTQYKLNGDEAVVQFDITLNGYTGAQQIIPQNALEITLMGATPDAVNEGFQLMNAEIAGTADVVVAPNTVTTLYKRYSYAPATGDMRYLVVTTYTNGEPTPYWFDIGSTQAAAVVAPESEEGTVDSEAPADGLTVGSEGEEVSRLQRALISKGLLQGSPDGKFGNYTAEAVKSMQKRYGMEATGVADQDFLNRLYADQ